MSLQRSSDASRSRHVKNNPLPHPSADVDKPQRREEIDRIPVYQC